MLEDIRTLEELQAEATGLGIKFHPNTGEAKLKEKIEEFYTNQSAGDLVEMKPEDNESDEDEDGEEDKTPKIEKAVIVEKKLTKNQKIRKLINESKTAAMKRRVVRITSNDKRDNDVTTVAYLGFENQYFGISRLVPLDIPLELEECLIDIAKSTKITLHKDEIANGKRTGNKTAVAVKKLNVSYEDVQ